MKLYIGPEDGMRISLCVCKNLLVSGSSVNPSTPDPRVSTSTVVALWNKSNQHKKQKELQWHVLTRRGNTQRQQDCSRPDKTSHAWFSRRNASFCIFQRWYLPVNSHQYSLIHPRDQRRPETPHLQRPSPPMCKLIEFMAIVTPYSPSRRNNTLDRLLLRMQPSE